MAKQHVSTRSNRREFTKGKVGRAARRRAYYARFRGGNNRVARGQA